MKTMPTMREELIREIQEQISEMVSRVEHLLEYERDCYPKERVFEEIRLLLEELG